MKKLALLMALAFSMTAHGLEPNKYYVAADGSDANDGLSPETAWQSLDKVNGTTFNPGDVIHFKGGDTWTGQLWPKGNGTAENRITLTSYGEGRPLINGNGTGRPTVDADESRGDSNSNSKDQVVSGAIQLIDQEYWVIENFEVTNQRTNFASNRSGILVYNSMPDPYSQTQYLHNITIRNNYVHDVDPLGSHSSWSYDGKYDQVFKHTGGIIGLSIPVHHTNGWKSGGNRLKAYDSNCGKTGRLGGFDGLLIENNYVENVSIEGIRTKVAWFNNGAGEISSGTSGTYPHINKNVSIRGNYIKNVYGDGIVIGEQLEKGLVECNYINGHTTLNNTNRYFAGVWAHYTKDTAIRGNEICNGKNGNSDGQAIDVDNDCHNTIVEYNYTHSNNHGFFMHMTTGSNHVVRYNVSIGDGKNNSTGNGWMLLRNNNEVAEIYNNTFIFSQPVNALFWGTTTKGNFQNNIWYVNESVNNGTLSNPTFNFSDGNNYVYVRNGVNVGASMLANNKTPDAASEIFEKSIDEIKQIVAQHDKGDDFVLNAAGENRPYLDMEKLRERVSMVKLKLYVDGELNPAANIAGELRKVAKWPTPDSKIDLFGNEITEMPRSAGVHNVMNEYESPDPDPDPNPDPDPDPNPEPEPEPNPNPEPEPDPANAYPIAFGKDERHSRKDRLFTGATVTSATYGVQTISKPDGQALYYEALDWDKGVNVAPGEVVDVHPTFSGGWMHGFFYIDRGNDGLFNVVKPTVLDDFWNDTDDCIAFSAANTKYNGLGGNTNYNSGSKNAISDSNTYDIPEFTMPELPNGFYRARLKVDWSRFHLPEGYAGDESVILAGDPGDNLTKDNGGGIFDFRLHVHGFDANLTVASDHGQLTNEKGTAIDATIPFGRALKFNAVPEAGYEVDKITVRYGYRFDGEAIRYGMEQWKEENLTADAEGTYQLSAEMTSADVLITVTYKEKAEPDGIAATSATKNASVFSANGMLVVENAQDNEVTVYTLPGAKLLSEKVNHTLQIALPQGVYIVRINNKVHKVLVQ